MIELYSGDAKRIQHFCKVHSYAKLIAETENVDKKCLFISNYSGPRHSKINSGVPENAFLIAS